MKRKVVLHGVLAKEFGREFQLDVKTPAEAIRALSANFKNFRARILELGSKGVGYKVLFGDAELERDEQLLEPLSKDGFELVPVLTGAGAFGRILTGIALIATAFVIDVVTLGSGITLNGILFSVGASLVLGGVAELLAPNPKTKEQKDSYLFNGPTNTTEQGHPVPLLYGRAIVGSALVSGGIVVEEIN